MNIHVIVCLYDLSRSRKLLHFLELLSSLLNNRFSLNIVLVLNHSDLNGIDFKEYKLKSIILQGNNNYGEFGAWQEGISFVNENFPTTNLDKYILCNDTLYFNYTPRLSGLINLFNSLVHIERNPMISGDFHSLPRIGKVLNNPVSGYIRTACFVLNAKAIEKIDSNLINVTPEDVKNKIGKSSYELLCSFFDSDVLAYKIGQWLFGGGWYKSEKYETFDPDFLSLKLSMIINEIYLSVCFNSKTEVDRIFDSNIDNSMLFQATIKFFRNFSISSFFKLYYAHCELKK